MILRYWTQIKQDTFSTICTEFCFQRIHFFLKSPLGTLLQCTGTDWWAPESVFFRESRRCCSAPHFPACQAECDSLDDSWHQEMSGRFHSLIKWGHQLLDFPERSSVSILWKGPFKLLWISLSNFKSLIMHSAMTFSSVPRQFFWLVLRTFCAHLQFPLSHILMDGEVKVVSFFVGSLEKHVS